MEKEEEKKGKEKGRRERNWERRETEARGIEERRKRSLATKKILKFQFKPYCRV